MEYVFIVLWIFLDFIEFFMCSFDMVASLISFLNLRIVAKCVSFLKHLNSCSSSCICSIYLFTLNLDSLLLEVSWAFLLSALNVALLIALRSFAFMVQVLGKHYS